jgi:hypothetical protein
MIGVYSIVDNSTATKERVTTEDREYLQLEAAFSRFETDFNSIYSPLYFSYEYVNNSDDKTVYDEQDNKYELNETESFTPTEKFPKMSQNGIPIPAIDNDKESSFGFFSSINKRKVQNVKQSNYVWIKHSLATNQDEEANPDASYNWVRQIYAENIYSPEHNWDDIKAYTLLTNVKKLEFQFWSPKREKYVSSVKELDDKFMITAVKIILEWVDPSGVARTIERSFHPFWPYFDAQKEKKLLSTRKIPGAGGGIAPRWTGGY